MSSKRFVILEHHYQGIHYDLMLEAVSTLRTWRLNQPPAHGIVCQAEQLPDHRLVYLDYQGPVSGDRGHVVRWDAGTYDGNTETDRTFSVQLRGKRLEGTLTIARDQEGKWNVHLE